MLGILIAGEVADTIDADGWRTKSIEEREEVWNDKRLNRDADNRTKDRINRMDRIYKIGDD